MSYGGQDLGCYVILANCFVKTFHFRWFPQVFFRPIFFCVASRMGGKPWKNKSKLEKKNKPTDQPPSLACRKLFERKWTWNVLQNWSSWSWVRGGWGLNYVVVTRNRILNANELNSITVSWMRSHVPLGTHKKEEKEFEKNLMKKSTEKGKTDQFKASERKHFTKLPLLLLLNWPPPPAVPRVGQRICPSRVRYAKKKKINSSIVITCPIASMKYAPALWTQGKPSAATVWKVEKS